ncbi:MAG: hypothetical protein RBT75_05640 [Anaerolineae bacterium]|jgi:hypothetical protein|nr:hypothetical protein [Anaerolineae bacterium]
MGILAEIKILFWLQWRLTRAMFRSRRFADRAQLLRLVLTLVQLVFTLPFFIAMGIGVAVGLAVISPGAALEMAMVGNTLLLFLWLLLPASQSSQIVERFEMSRLFIYPVSFRGLIAGSTLMSLLSMTGLWTVPLLLGEVVGLAWHAPLALPLILLGALPLFALLTLSGRIMEDLFDLVSGDRRLRAIAMTLLTLPFIALWLGQYAVQFYVNRMESPPDFLVPLITSLEGVSDFSAVVEILRPSRWLLWLPPGWATAGMGMVVKGDWAGMLFFLPLSLLAVGGLLWLHAGVTRRLMDGAALTLGAERVRSRRLGITLPGPDAFWALFHKDWVHLTRNPIPRRLFFSSLVMTVAMSFSSFTMSESEMPPDAQSIFALGTWGFLIVLLNLMANSGLLGNYFGVIDREGFSTLMLSGIDRRHILLSAASVTSVFALLQAAVVTLVIAIVNRQWSLFFLGAMTALVLQLSSIPAYLLASIIGPYRMQLKFNNQRQRGNMWSMLAWVVSIPPVIVLIALPYALWRPALWFTLPLALLYGVGLNALTLKPLARLLQKREDGILEAITRE